MARRKARGRPINGWLVLDKPSGITSTGALTAAKRLIDPAKAGHGGTLDPLATGVLPLAFGEATKTVPYIMDGTKSYRFSLRFGEARDTDDAEGVALKTSAHRPDDAGIEDALQDYRGVVAQVPPFYAAVKVAGERAYDLARRGEVFQLEAREVRIDRLVMIDRPDADRAVFEMDCGKGTYVRALARDLGEQLGCFAHVETLRRTRVGPFRIEDAVGLDVLERLVADDALLQVLAPVSTALADIPALAVTEPQALRLRSGQRIRVAPGLLVGSSEEGNTTVRAMLADRTVALGRLEGADLDPVRVFND
ncbi:tRNA pseudouridine(55) synthase TruB [Marinivivus vitaminiproducens]|uniref:tRNA pseudouridine(55) synthase TruB n=1 Tax=Marinivivus vitaminiproducens TaxID=3035935 RepID=UPI0027A04555|nr:tRNA pseudouridine(55) synthase TruB [Geminicoccaceae bacterium SCSIO 64248]